MLGIKVNLVKGLWWFYGSLTNRTVNRGSYTKLIGGGGGGARGGGGIKTDWFGQKPDLERVGYEFCCRSLLWNESILSLESIVSSGDTITPVPVNKRRQIWVTLHANFQWSFNIIKIQTKKHKVVCKLYGLHPTLHHYCTKAVCLCRIFPINSLTPRDAYMRR